MDHYYYLGFSELLGRSTVTKASLRAAGVDASLFEHLAGSLVYPCLAAFPMGWAWVMWIAQRIHCFFAMQGSGIRCDRILCHGHPYLDLSDGRRVLLPYVDSLAIGGTCRDGCKVGSREGGLFRT